MGEVMPRVLALDDACKYVGLSRTSFLNTAGRDVPPLRLTERRRGWDRLALDRWVDSLATSTPLDEEPIMGNPLDYLVR